MNASDLVLSDQTLNLIGLVPLVYGIPSMVIYVYSLAVLLRNFREPFYRLFGFCGVLVSQLVRDTVTPKVSLSKKSM